MMRSMIQYYQYYRSKFIQLSLLLNSCSIIFFLLLNLNSYSIIESFVYFMDDHAEFYGFLNEFDHH